MPAKSLAQYKWAQAKLGDPQASPDQRKYAAELVSKQAGKPVSALPRKAPARKNAKRLADY